MMQLGCHQNIEQNLQFIKLDFDRFVECAEDKEFASMPFDSLRASLENIKRSFIRLEAINDFIEIRKNDRGFSVGDCVLLREYDPSNNTYTGLECTRRIIYVFVGGGFGVEDGYCVLGLEVLD